MSREIDLQSPFNTAYFKDFYNSYRNRYEDLFPSEQRFFDEFAQPKKSYLDVGCAVGGIYAILAARCTDFKYTGVDIAHELLELARRAHPGIDFRHCDGITLPFANNAFDRILSLGTTVHDQEYGRLVRECYRVCAESFLFDMRLSAGMPTISRLAEAYVLDGAGLKYPYVVANAKEFIALLQQLTPTPATIRIYGYWGKANQYTRLPTGYESICMCGVFVSKPAAGMQGAAILELDLPFDL